MKKKLGFGFMLVLASIALASCGKKDNNKKEDEVITDVIPQDTSTADATDAEEAKVEITEEFSLKNVSTSAAIIPVDGVYTITEAGEYDAKGKLTNGKICVDAADQKITINLDGVSIESNVDSCIYVIDADKVEIAAKKDTYNELIDNRTSYDSSSEEDTLGSAAIFSNSDLEIRGKGNLVVKSTYNNGIHSKDDLEIKNLTLKVSAVNNCLKGNDSVTVESGNIILISSAGDGIKTTNSDISSKLVQRGNIDINGGIIDIYSSCDGLDASYDVNINKTVDVDAPILNIHTASYSSYSDETVAKDSTVYLKMSATYSSSYRYALYFYNDDQSNGVFKDVTYKTVLSSGRGVSYYFYEGSMPSDYKNIKIYAFSNNQTENSIDNYYAVSDGGVINQSFDTLQITSISSSKISYSWTAYQTQQQGMPGGQATNVNKLDYSAKGIKADNNININDGNIKIYAYDDAIHSNRGNLLENGSTGEGSVNLYGGDLIIQTQDDGIHADYVLTIDGANVNIQTSHEGLESNQILMKSGTANVVGQDDGVNASGSYLSKLVNVIGGSLFVTVGSGDTDGIDSNGDYKQSGGFVVARCGASGGGCGALDVDGSITITDGTFIGAGPIEALPSTSSINYVSFGSVTQMGGGFPGQQSSSSGSSISFASGTYTVYDSSDNKLFDFELSSSYTNMWIASSQFVKGSSYKLKTSSTTYSWSQSAQSATGSKA